MGGSFSFMSQDDKYKKGLKDIHYHPVFDDVCNDSCAHFEFDYVSGCRIHCHGTILQSLM